MPKEQVSKRKGTPNITLTPQVNCQYERHRGVRAILGPVTAFHASMR
ncbi:hypothetical protein PPIS_b0159 [Pseudoalteromonas piscicida]|uniref:Uncharacterized protein n=1 Tax=Pseudoalteromonas piscicida TaxID=43662 RepID=A0ABM6NK95_PSEO7|nr:hypothetical protein PPIS_b0159 [Pseudoalteromonas piscicida]